MNGQLTEQQISVLLRGIKPGRVQKRDGQSNLQAYDVRAHLNRMFGFGNWDDTATEPTTLLFEQQAETKAGKPAYRVGYRATRTLTIRNHDGEHVCTYHGTAVGDTILPDYLRGDAHDFAIKKAESQALKRAAANLGDQFGLSLYGKGSLAPIVGAVVGFQPTGAVEPDLTEPDVVEETHDVALEVDTSSVDADDSPVSVPTDAEFVPETGEQLALGEESAVPAGPMVTDAQVKMMQTLFGRLGVKERTAKLDYLSRQAGRKVASSKVLTKAEAISIITTMQAEVDGAPE